ncbi:MAG TPA: ATP-binding protein [Chitinophagaceae bacterium]|nr:ATP-binding protein [Chitinophagaceae bacterium]
MKKAVLILLLGIARLGFTQDNPIIDSLKGSLTFGNADSSTLWRLSLDYMTINSDSCRIYSRQLYDLGLKAHSAFCKGWGLGISGVMMDETGNYSSSFPVYEQAMNIFIRSGDSCGICVIDFRLGLLYSNAGFPDLGQGFYQKVLKFAPADPHFFNRNYPSYYGRFFKGLTMLDLSQYYLNHSKLDSALICAHSFMRILSGIPEKRYQGDGLIIIGQVYRIQGHMELAMKYLKQAAYLLAANGNKSGLSRAYARIGELFDEEKVPDSAYYYALRSFMTAKKAGYYPSIAASGVILTKYFRSKNHLDSAFWYQEITLGAKDSLSRENKRHSFQIMVIREQLDRQRNDEARQQLVNKIRFFVLLSGVVILLLLALGLWLNNRQKKKSNIQLNRQKTDLELAMAGLKATQQQLIQAEKMASLGELTAGIAHEIQNPLNFVNNFSEVSIELAGELKGEIDKTALTTEEKSALTLLSDDLINNQQKINQHGRRADSIVKSMLQHSRKSSGEKESVDINELADEYLRLSYHGLRAKDKGFNAALETRFDAEIGKIPVFPQDMGRVLLNLFNNAFYSVSEKMKSGNPGFAPLVSVSSKKIGNMVELRVMDNGMGIPVMERDKIFLPFFTTKPTGEGTGLGLSISYDIVTRQHGGKLLVESQPGEYATFIILLPDK